MGMKKKKIFVLVLFQIFVSAYATSTQYQVSDYRGKAPDDSIEIEEN